MVYFMRGLETGLIKIGITVDLNQRVKDVGEKVEILGAVQLTDKPDLELEAELHEQFRPLGVFGEWFSDDGSIETFLGILLKHGIAMNPARAFEWSEQMQWSREFRVSRNERAIDNEFVRVVHEAAVKRARARRLAKFAEEAYDASVLEEA